MVWAKRARRVTITTVNKNKAPRFRQAGDATVRVWDLPTRIFHWLLVVCFIGSWITAEAGFDYTEAHMRFGYATLGLVLFRLLWGFLGNRYARFRTFVKSPLIALKSFPDLIDDTADRHTGHSPYAGYAVLLLLYFAGAQAVSGLFISDDILYSGPYNPIVSNDLAGTLAWYHHINFTLFQITAAVHILAILWYRLRKREGLTVPMLTGKKRSGTAAERVNPLKAIIVIVLCASAVAALVELAPEPTYDDYF